MLSGTQYPILVVGFGSDRAGEVIAPLQAAGFPLRLGTVSDVPKQRWSLVISPPVIPGLAGMELLAAVDALGAHAPLRLVVGALAQLPVNVPGVQGFAWPFSPADLVERVQGMLLTPGEADAFDSDPANTIQLLDEDAMLRRTGIEWEDLLGGRTPADSFVVSVRLDEFDRYREQVSQDVEASLWQQLAQLAQLDAAADEQQGVGSKGDFLLLLPGLRRSEAQIRLERLSGSIANNPFLLGGQATTFSPVIGYASLRRSPDAAQALVRAREAGAKSALHLDLHPELWKARTVARKAEVNALIAWFSGVYQRHLLIVQYLFTMALGLGVPFLVYWWLGTHRMDISGAVYNFVVVALLLTAISIWFEGVLAMRRVDPPLEPASPFPRASAIIAAYLPNEAPIIEATVRAFLRVQYPGPLQVILAYNSPRDMPEIEARLAEIAREDSRFIPMRIRTSTSKAQNVNAALPYATGEFTAVFDADHQPDADAFRRAWRWISHGADVVQGHCFIRNGDASWVSRMVAIEFEQIYAVSHPGRARLHGFGIFGGSNGYWRTPLLRELRMHGFMLTEDIDSSMRAVVRGRQIISDPYLVSRELAPETLQALTKQRLRWAQGWLQISVKWIMPALRSPHLSVRQKLGMVQLLAWREAYPWVSMQIIPLVAWWAVEAGSLWRIDWVVPLFVVTSLFTLGTGPGQIWFTWRLSDPQLKRHPTWFWSYVVTSTLFYAGLKNAWNRIAHYKEWRGETTWVVTPRVTAKK